MAGPLTALAVMGGAPLAQAASLSLVFPALKSQGEVSVAVFKSPADWKLRSNAVWAGTHQVKTAQTRLELDLPPGVYGVMAYHDRNSNDRLDTLPIGLPTEPYGFSNNARGAFGPPAWSAAAFTLPAQGATQTLRLK